MQEVLKKIVEKIEARIKSFETLDIGDPIVDAAMKENRRCIEIINEVAEEYKSNLSETFTGWIPCSERLPEDCEIREVTAMLCDGRTYTEFAYYDEPREEWWKFDDDGLVNVLAWKEHSEPYQPEDKTPKQTNADRIRAMDIDELALAIMCPNEMSESVIGESYIPCDKSDDCNCFECCKEWLQKEVEE